MLFRFIPKLIFLSDIQKVLAEKRRQGVILNDVLGTARRIFLQKRETQTLKKEKNRPEDILSELDNL